MTCRLADQPPHTSEASPQCVRIPRQHRLYSMSRYLSQVGIVDATNPQMRNVAVAALMRSNV